MSDVIDRKPVAQRVPHGSLGATGLLAVIPAAFVHQVNEPDVCRSQSVVEGCQSGGTRERLLLFGLFEQVQKTILVIGEDLQAVQFAFEFIRL